MAHRPAPLPLRRLPRVFTAAEARTLGVPRQRLRAGDILRVGYGLFALRDVVLREEDLVAAYTRGHPSVRACGPTAARLWRLPLPGRWGHDVEFLPRDRPQLTLDDGRSHRASTSWVSWSHRSIGAEDLVRLRGVPSTSRDRTWADLSTVLDVDDLIVIGDHLVRHPRFEFEGRTEPLSSREALQRIAQDRSGRGRSALRAAVASIRVGSDSPAETRLRLALLRGGLPMPSLNARILDGGVDLGCPDLSWDRWKVCAEHEGPSHLTPTQLERDIRRGERRSRHGWIEVRTTALDLRDGGHRAVERVTDALRRHGWSPGR